MERWAVSYRPAFEEFGPKPKRTTNAVRLNAERRSRECVIGAGQDLIPRITRPVSFATKNVHRRWREDEPSARAILASPAYLVRVARRFQLGYNLSLCGSVAQW